MRQCKGMPRDQGRVTRRGPAPVLTGNGERRMTWTEGFDNEAMADAFEIYGKWVGLEGWKVTIRKKNVGQPWQRCKLEGYHELTPGELLDVLDSSLAHWLES